MKPHPLSLMFPPMHKDDADALAEDVKANGLRDPIITYDGMILDGRNRYVACRTAGVDPAYKEYDGPTDTASLAAYVFSVNYHRRHLTTGQRAASAAEYATLKKGQQPNDQTNGKVKSENFPILTQKQAAKQFDVSDKSIRTAAKVKEADPELFEEVKSGETTLNAAAKKIGVKPPNPPKRKQTKKKDDLTDALGCPVPDRLRDVFGDPWLEDLAAIIDGIRTTINSSKIAGVIKGKSQAYGAFLRAGEMLKALAAADDLLEDVEDDIKAGTPHAVHAACEGKGCKDCRKMGWVPKWRFEELAQEASR